MNGQAIDSSLPSMLWATVARLLDATRTLGPGEALALAALLGAALAGCAVWLQVHQRTTLAADPATRVRLVRADWARTLPALPLWPLALALRALVALRRRRAARRSEESVKTVPGTDDTSANASVKTVPGTDAPGTDAPVKTVPGTDAPPFLAVTLGPTFLLAAVGVGGLYLLGRFTEPLLALSLDAPPRLRAWQVLLLGHRPELAWSLPLDERPAQAALVCFVVFATAWALFARLLRALWADRLAADQWHRRDDDSLLPTWRGWCGARDLVAPAPVDAAWTTALLAASAALLALAWLTLDTSPFGPRPSAVAAASVLWLGWATHRLLAGGRRDVDPPPAAPAPAPTEPGWPDVLAELAARHGCVEPDPAEPPRPLPPAPALPVAPPSPLLAELMDDLDALTELQAVELRRLAALQQVDPETTDAVTTDAANDHLQLPTVGAESDPRARDLRRQRIVLAPEGAGKTLFGLLAACQTTLLTARASLLVARDAAAARALHERLRRRVGSSTARWSLRIRCLTAERSSAGDATGDGVGDGVLGDGFFGDLARGITPDILIVDLHTLVTHVLADVQGAAPLLRRIGLVVVDDAESYRGPVEVHARLAFRRLRGQLHQLQEVDILGDDGDPLFVLLAADSMQRTEAWLRELVGIEAGTASYDPGVDDPASDDPASDDAANRAPGVQLVYHLDDFRRVDGAALSADELIEACERRGVAWHARAAGDGRRSLGLRRRLETREPRHHSDADEAAVVLIEGSWSAVRREIERLRHAGRRHLARRAERGDTRNNDTAPRMALVTVVDRDEDLAFSSLDEAAALSRLVRRAPRPVLRTPGAGCSVDAHLGCDLAQGFTEVGDLVARFGEAAARTLRALARSSLLSTQGREQLSSSDGQAASLLFVRVLGRAVGNAHDRLDTAQLPPPPTQVELTAGRTLELVDRDTGASLGRVEAATAPAVLYPGRLVERRRGRFVVAAPTTARGEAAGHRIEPVVWLEPTLSDAVSSPRRRLRLVGAPLEPADAAPTPHWLGDRPLHVARGRRRVVVEHYGAVRLAPADGTIRQRIQLPAPVVAPPFATEALWIALDGLAVAAGDPSDRDAARLVAAALRLALPVLLRGGDEDVAVDLTGFSENSSDENSSDENSSDEPSSTPRGLVILDLQEDGNGCARALERDGLEPLLRLARAVLERVLDPTRLLARHDHWPNAPLAAEPERVQALRRHALTWLDAHLPPEGGPAAATRAAAVGESEPGEGDAFDLGRCWWSRDGALDRLLWTHQRWRRPSGADAALDVAFDRVTVAAHRRASAPDATSQASLRSGEVVWPDLEADTTEADTTEADTTEPYDDTMQALHRRLVDLAARAREPLGPLARRLAEALDGPDTDALAERRAFVAALPNALPEPSGDASETPRDPLVLLLERRGDERSRALLLAVLAERALDAPAGLFVHGPSRAWIVGLPDDRLAETGPDDDSARALVDGTAFVPITPLERSADGTPPWIFLPLWPTETPTETPTEAPTERPSRDPSPGDAA